MWTADTLRSPLEEALQELKETHGQALWEAVSPVIQTNLSRGRIERILTNQGDMTPQKYVLRVAEIYQKLHPYLAELQEERSPQAWQALYDLMCKIAMKFLLRHGFSVMQETRELTEECTSEVASQILTAHFPYDVEFFPWMYVVLRNVCVGKIKKLRQTNAQDISELEEWLEDATSPTGRKIEKDLGMRQAFREALKKLSPGRQEVIYLHYFEDRSFQEIAEMMGKTANAVHQLHFYAMRDLEKLLANP